ncbi:MAG: hypothetical protein JXA93_07150 [Anaerolineae bacterium]|nr:hypothetical protein [Anaerolineae bacterium]
MTGRSDEITEGGPRWGYVGLAVAVFCSGALILAGLFQLSRLVPALGVQPSPTATAAAHSLSPTPAATAAVSEPAIVSITAAADDATRTIRFQLDAAVAPDRTIDEVILWYDTAAGQQLQRISGPLGSETTITHRLDATSEGLTRSLTVTQPLDYWWLVRDTAGDWTRAGSTVSLGPALQSLVALPTLPLPTTGFTWTVSETEHFGFYYAPGTAAERDRFQIGALAETSLDMISDALDMPFGEQMDIYLVPRVFWQGGAAYGDKVQLIAYLDRNYTAVETWSYFTHEGTHALAQDLLQPKEEGGPDGVLVEGLAVWASKGHYRQEPIDAWAALIATSDDYLPLADLRAGPFYDFQHETAYLESASFVQFLIEQYGLEAFKELYGRATGDAAGDNLIVRELYGRDYDELEADWLNHLAAIDPTPEQVDLWHLKVRSFELMRRYETEMDPDARMLPPVPTSWASDTLRAFLTRRGEPENVVLETALIAAQERMYGGDLAGARSLLDDVEACLDVGEADRPSLSARRTIVDLLAEHDRARLRADATAYHATVAPGGPLAAPAAVEAALMPPFVEYRQEVVRLDVSDDGSTATGVVRLHSRLAWEDAAFEQDGQLFAVTLVNTPAGWRLWKRQPFPVDLAPPPTAPERATE